MKAVNLFACGQRTRFCGAEFLSHPTVSFDDEPLILVDAEDNITGYRTKLAAHQGRGLLHRAFSIFLFDGEDRLLLQQRSRDKPLWPLYWSNSCCSHPRRGETYDSAIHRRLREELSIDTALEFVFRFQYQASFQQLGSEHELCSVYIGRVVDGDAIDVNPSEIAALRWLNRAEIDQLFKEQPDQVTPWFVIEWQRLRQEFSEQLDRLPGA